MMKIEYAKYALDPWFVKTGKIKNMEYMAEIIDSGNMVIAFHSANEEMDFLRVILPAFALWKKWKRRRAHRGFLKMWQELKPSIMRRIEELKPTAIYMPGCSMGAGLAQIAFHDLMMERVFVDRHAEKQLFAPVKAFHLPRYKAKAMVIKGDIVSKFPFWFIQRWNATVVDSGYKWYQFVKKHKFFREWMREQVMHERIGKMELVTE